MELYNAVMSGKTVSPKQITEKERSVLLANVVKQGSGILPAWAGGYALRPDAAIAINTQVEPLFEAWRATGLTDQEAMVRATNELLGPDRGDGKAGGVRGEILGGYYIERTPTATGEPIANLMNGKGSQFVAVPDNIKNDVFANFINDPAGVAMPKDVGTTRIFRAGDNAIGQANFSVYGIDKNGATIIRNFSEQQLATYAADKTKWKRINANGVARNLTAEEQNAWTDDYNRRTQPVELPSLSFGAPITYTPENYRKGVEILQKQAEQLRKSNK